MLRLPLQPLWQRLAALPVWQPTRLAIAGSIVLHGIILSIVRIPDATPPALETAEAVELVSIPPELAADLPSIEPLLPTELPAFETAPPPLPFTGIEPPPLSFAPLAPLPPLPPLAELPPPLSFSPLAPLPPLWQLPPPARPLPELGSPEDEVAVAPELAQPPTPAPEAPDDPVATTEGEAAAALSRWFNQTRLTLNTTNIGVNLSQRVTDVYPSAACGDRLQGQATVAVVITPEGQLLPANAAPETGLLSRNPQIIRTSGSALLDEAAIATVRQQTFSATGQYQALAITFDFQYRPENCNAARPTAPAPTSTPTPAPTGSATTAPSVEPSPSPAPPTATPEPAAPSEVPPETP